MFSCTHDVSRKIACSGPRERKAPSQCRSSLEAKGAHNSRHLNNACRWAQTANRSIGSVLVQKHARRPFLRRVTEGIRPRRQEEQRRRQDTGHGHLGIALPVWKSTSELGQVYLSEPPRHRFRRGHGDNVASMAWGARNLISTQFLASHRADTDDDSMYAETKHKTARILKIWIMLTSVHLP